MITTSNKPMIEDYLDAAGSVRYFKLTLVATDRFLEAAECTKEGEATGFRFIMPVSPDGVPPWGEMRDKIRQRLAQRDLVHDPRTGELHIMADLIRGQIKRGEDGVGGLPNLIVDGMKISWTDLGLLLNQYEGWGLRMEIRETGEE